MGDCLDCRDSCFRFLNVVEVDVGSRNVGNALVRLSNEYDPLSVSSDVHLWFAVGKY